MHQLDLVAAAVEQRRQPPADSEVELHARVLGVLRVHVVALLVRDHLERQLVVVAQEQAPLAVVGDLRRLGQDLVHRRRLLAAQRHEHPRHDREVKAHVALVAVAEVLHDVGRPLVGLREQDAVRIAGVDLRAQALEELVRLGQVLTVGAVALVEVRDRVETEAVEPEVQPEAQDLEHRLLDLDVVVVEVRLVREEAVPEVRVRVVVPGPVGGLGVDEDDPRVLVAVHGVRPHVPVALGALGARARLLKPGVIARGVVHHQVGDHADPTLVRGLDEVAHVVDRPVVRLDREEVRDVVAAVAQRRPVEGQQPDAVDAEPLQVVELVDQPAEVAGPVAVSVEEGAGVNLVEDGRLEPQRLGLEPVAGVAQASTPKMWAWRTHGSKRT